MILHGIEITKLNNLNELVEFYKCLKVAKGLYKSTHKYEDKEYDAKSGCNDGKHTETQWLSRNAESDPNSKSKGSPKCGCNKWCNLHQITTWMNVRC